MTAPQQKPGDSAYAVAQQQLGKPYVYGATGPDSFDCSGLMQYSYLNGPGIQIGRDTTAQWNNQTTLTTFYDAINPVPNQLSPNALAGGLEVGDLLLYFQPGNSGEYAHVKMYAGNGQTIEAPHTGAVVCMNPVDLVGDTTEPFRGVKRSTGGGSTGGAAAGGGSSSQGSGSSQSSTQIGGAATDPKDPNLATEDLPDPRNDLPFSAAFMGVGGWKFSSPNRGNVQQSLQIVRGGMVELYAPNASGTGGTPRKGGQFACYFMMNPLTIDVSCAIDTSVAAPSQTNQSQQQQAPLWIQQQSITFDVVFNRQYEVWQGGVKGPNGQPGPSDIGVRWDIRAIERLMGMYDAKASDTGKGNTSGTTGLGVYGEGSRPPQSLNVQVVFGGQMSYQFQGVIASLDYEYSLFDGNMIPIEATATVGIMRRWLPMISSADIVNPLVTQMGQSGAITFPATQYLHTFNANTGLVKTSKVGGGIAL
jgi:cell wall-associated NlpC family hydrolase